MEKIDILEFAKNTKNLNLCWFLGSGMNFTAGIPVTSNIVKRMLLWDSLGLNKEKLRDFHKEYSWGETILGSEYRRGDIESAESLYRKDKNITKSEPLDYFKVTSDLLTKPQLTRSFIFELIRLAPQINRSNASLAQFIIRHAISKQIILTTNYDDC